MDSKGSCLLAVPVRSTGTQSPSPRGGGRGWGQFWGADLWKGIFRQAQTALSGAVPSIRKPLWIQKAIAFWRCRCAAPARNPPPLGRGQGVGEALGCRLRIKTFSTRSNRPFGGGSLYQKTTMDSKGSCLLAVPVRSTGTQSPSPRGGGRGVGEALGCRLRIKTFSTRSNRPFGGIFLTFPILCAIMGKTSQEVRHAA